MTRVLIFNFLGGVMERGIPVYTRELTRQVRAMGFEVVELRCPALLRRAPPAVLKLLFVLFEQLLAPVARIVLRCRFSVYPYNSAGLLDTLLGRSVLVVHDLIPNHSPRRSLAGAYICATQALHRALGRPVCAASPHTLKLLRRLPVFRRCVLHLWPNPFFEFEEALARAKPPRTKEPGQCTVLLCTGMGPNKDYPGALALFRASQALQGARLRIVGFGNDAPLARRRLQALSASERQAIEVLPWISLDELASEILHCDLVWVHSRKEGFGRFVMEARLCGRSVVATDIGAFRRFRDLGVLLYRDEDFDATVARALQQRGGMEQPDPQYYRRPLERAITEVFEALA